MNCRECKEHLYEYLDRELTPAVEQEIRQHIADCPPCGEEFDFEKLFLGFLPARCRAQGAPPDLKRRSLDELLDERSGSPPSVWSPTARCARGYHRPGNAARRSGRGDHRVADARAYAPGHGSGSCYRGRRRRWGHAPGPNLGEHAPEQARGPAG